MKKIDVPEGAKTFEVILCDNDVDKYHECFSDTALLQMKDSFLGKKGTYPIESNKVAKAAVIYDTYLKIVPDRKTEDGRPLVQLRAKVFLDPSCSIEPPETAEQIPVGFACQTTRRICSICGANSFDKGCRHKPGSYYDGKLCMTVIDNVLKIFSWDVKRKEG